MAQNVYVLALEAALVRAAEIHCLKHLAKIWEYLVLRHLRVALWTLPVHNDLMNALGAYCEFSARTNWLIRFYHKSLAETASAVAELFLRLLVTEVHVSRKKLLLVVWEQQDALIMLCQNPGNRFQILSLVLVLLLRVSPETQPRKRVPLLLGERRALGHWSENVG